MLTTALINLLDNEYLEQGIYNANLIKEFYYDYDILLNHKSADCESA